MPNSDAYGTEAALKPFFCTILMFFVVFSAAMVSAADKGSERVSRAAQLLGRAVSGQKSAADVDRESIASIREEAEKGIPEAQYTLGAFGILIKVYAHDNEHLLSLLNTKIQAIPGVADTTTLTTLAQPIYRQLPIEI